MKETTETRAFLAWFLEHYYHLDEIEIQDCICDKEYDKGVDGIYVNDAFERIDVFQNNMSQNPNGAHIGDVDLKTFNGTLLQFQDASSIRQLEVSKTINRELKALLQREKVAEKVEGGYTVRGVYLTNRTKGVDAEEYLTHNPNIILYDATELEAGYVPLDKPVPIGTPISFDISDVPHMDYNIASDLRMVIAPLAAQELINMAGIVSGELFAPNVRYWLGKNTTVNKGITDSIGKPQEHKYFPAFHNGLIVLCGELRVAKNKITVSKYAVVNGCQSLKGLFDNASHLSPDLKILTKFIRVSPDSDLAKKITYRTNNQNGIKARDLQSNSTIQNRIQAEIHSKYKGEFFYRISRGEQPKIDPQNIIENTVAGQLLLAFDLRRPDTTHLVDAKIFDDLHKDIFGRPEVNADRVIALYELDQVASSHLAKLSDRKFAQYALTRFFMVYLVREVLDKDSLGRKFFDNPSEFIDQPKGRERWRYCVDNISKVLARTLDNVYLRRNKDQEFFDYKGELRNSKSVADLNDDVMLRYDVLVDDDSAKTFSELWATSETAV